MLQSMDSSSSSDIPIWLLALNAPARTGNTTPLEGETNSVRHEYKHFKELQHETMHVTDPCIISISAVLVCQWSSGDIDGHLHIHPSGESGVPA